MSNELVTIEQPKPSFMQSVKAFFYRIGNGDKKLKNGPIADLNKITERIIQNDVPALKDRNQTEQVSFAKEMKKNYEQLVVGETSISDSEIFREVTASKKVGEQNASLSVIANLCKNQKKSVLNKGKESLTKDKSVEKQIETQVEKDIEER